MSKDGGYKIIDLNNINITSAPVEIRGIFIEMEKNYRKVFLISGLKINGNEFSDTFANVKKIGGQYIIHAFNTIYDNTLDEYDLIIQDDDTISLSVKTVTGGGELPQNIFIVREEEK